MKLDGRDELSAAVASATSVEELLAVVAGELSDETALASPVEQWPAADGEARTGDDDQPNLSAIRGVVSDATDRSPRELIAESRARDREREQRLTDAG